MRLVKKIISVALSWLPMAIPYSACAQTVETPLILPADVRLPDDVRVGATIAPTTFLGNLRHKLSPSPAPDCCPPVSGPTNPASPASPTEPKKSETPKSPDEPAAPGPDQFAGTTEAGTQPGAMFNPYMFGDQFGAGRGNFTAKVGSLTAQSFLTNNGTSNTVVPVSSPTTPLTIPITNSFIYASKGGNTNFTIPVQLPSIASSSSPINTNVVTSVNATQAFVTLFPLPGVSFGGGGIPLQNNQTYQQFIDSVFKQRFGSNGQTVFQSGNLSAGTGTTGTPLNSPAAQINFTPNTEVYFNYSYVANFSVPLPSAGGVVGTTKISENNSPMPRDRLIFDYDFFSRVPLTAGGFNVDRFSPGFEKTFFGGRTSVELRLPFASTLDTSSVAGGATSRATELGNLNMTFKGLFYASEILNLSSGLGVALPTSADTRVGLSDGTDLVHIKNESVIVTPYIAGLYTPNDRFFAQAWSEIGFDASGSPVYANPTLNGIVGVGRIYDQVLLQLDAQAGYWLVRESNNAVTLTGLAPFLELHYNTPLNNSNTIQSGSFNIGSSTGRYNELNVAMGVNTVFRNRLSLMTGVVLPLESGNNRFFDAQFGVRANWLFGPSTPRTALVSNY